MRKGGARAGDQLYLTKPLGTGIITTAAKLTGPGENSMHRLARKAQGKPDLDVRDLDAAVVSMLQLNRTAAQAARAAGVRSATDITGFGLLGHSSEMALASGRENGVGFVIEAAATPVLPGVERYLAAGYLTRGAVRNPAHFGEHVRIDERVPPHLRTILWESETSGGLLLAVPKDAVTAFEQHCTEHKQPVWRIGEVVPGGGIQVK
jgi:selenide,water dikinase